MRGACLFGAAARVGLVVSQLSGRPESCACEHNRYCCAGWSPACDACEAGDGNRFGCAQGACSGASALISFPFARAELTVAGRPPTGPYRDFSDGGMHGGRYDGVLAAVTFMQVDNGVEIAYSMQGLVPGSSYTLQIHEMATFTNGCASGGSAFNLSNSNTLSDATQLTPGDLGNVVADDRGIATGTFAESHVMLAGEASIVGRSIALHDAGTIMSDGRLACGLIVGSQHGCTLTPSSQPIVGRQCQEVNVLAAPGTTSGMVLGREQESRAVCTYVPCRPMGYKYPLIVLLHGYGSNGTRQEMYERFAPMADEMGFILAIPHGTYETPSGNRFWSATDACCNFGPYGSPDLGGSRETYMYRIDNRARVDDSGYIRQLIQVIQSIYSVDSRRIYATGHSNGGYMSHRMACDHADLLAGVASLAGSTFEGIISGEYDLPSVIAESGDYIDYMESYSCSPSHPIHVLEIHGTGDTVVPYAGGRPTGNKTLGATTTFSAWARLNACDNDAVQIKSLALDMVTPPSPDTDVHVATGCETGGGSELWTIRGAAHSPRWLAAGNGATTMSWHTVQWLLAHPKPALGWESTIAALQDPETPVAAWRDAVMPIAMATKFTYTQTWCSYRGDQSETLPGWRKLRAINPEDGPCNNVHTTDGTSLGACDVIDSTTGMRRGGMHALAFISDDGGRLILAFRGTDLDPSAISGRADSCSNTMRGGVAFEDLPWPKCAGFTYHQLDYIARAREFVLSVLTEVGPVPDVITTGHSLGSHLATMMAVEFGFWSVSFGSGGGEHSVVACDGLHGSCAVPKRDLCIPIEKPPVEQRLLTLNNPYDPGHYRATERGMMGWVCAWDGQFEEPVPCKACYEENEQHQCALCFAQTHIYALYLDLVLTAEHPPVCVQHPAVELCSSMVPNSTSQASMEAGTLGADVALKPEPQTRGASSTNTTDVQLGTFDSAEAVLQERLAQVNAVVGPSGLIVGGIIIGLGLACCRSILCRARYKKQRRESGYEPVTFTHE